ncbi:DUF1223 domain-containing protein [Methylophaga sp.]|uniref:DUF1223 domain-containing protein n=1 Tax=Methylophaga sp. TaxID=2024840 RepID=UPI003F69C76A
MYRLLLTLLMCIQSTAWAVEFSSQEQATTVVELYTSEGCSSCPPADDWLSSLKNDSQLFNTLLPMAFHVDYWDQLGWQDRLAKAAYSQRQRNLVRQELLSQVYTPGIVINSQEWRGWFQGKRQPPINNAKPGRLQASLNGNTLLATFAQKRSLVLNMAWLGMGLETQVEAGENRGRKLKHDFVVLDNWQKSGVHQWHVTVPDIPAKGQQQTVLAIWLTKPDSLVIIQAAATYID